MNNLLEMIKNGSSISTPELAEKTGSTVEMVLAKLEYYEAMHLIRRVTLAEEDCGGHCGKKQCAGCPHSPQNKTPVTMWETVTGDSCK